MIRKLLSANPARVGRFNGPGITAGMDLALALVEEDHGHQVALEIARILVMFLVRPGGQSQYQPYALAANGNIATTPRTAGLDD
jgi:transcriptional regulator GlxA family with amidase domain